MASNLKALSLHPAIALAYGGIAMVLAMAFVQPVLSAVAFVGIASFGLLAFGMRSFAKRLLWQVPLVAAIIVLNCLFVQQGSSVLLSIGGFGIHMESLVYGASFGLALASAMEIFAILGEVVPGDDAISLFGRHLPSTALLASMSLRLIPRIRHSADERRDALKACTALASPEGKLKEASEEVSVMIVNAMEDSLVTADSMRARGYGSGRVRTHYVRRRFSAADGVALACVVALGACAFLAGIAASAGFAFYPTIENGATPIECIPFALFFLLPHAAYALGRVRWRRVTGRV